MATSRVIVRFDDDEEKHPLNSKSVLLFVSCVIYDGVLCSLVMNVQIIFYRLAWSMK